MFLTKVVLEETVANGVADSPPMSLFDLMISLEKQGVLDTKLSGHTLSRPPSVQRGDESDRQGLPKSRHK